MEKIDQILESLYDRVIEPIEAKQQLLDLFAVSGSLPSLDDATKVSKTQKPANCGYTVLATVPYQLCPKCGGDGTVMVQNWNGSNTSISSGVETCNLCGGAMIIPMHIIPTEYKIQG